MKKLDKDTIEAKLLHFPDWDYYDDALHAEFEFNTSAINVEPDLGSENM